jgi:hypothetical protein
VAEGNHEGGLIRHCRGPGFRRSCRGLRRTVIGGRSINLAAGIKVLPDVVVVGSGQSVRDSAAGDFQQVGNLLVACYGVNSMVRLGIESRPFSKLSDGGRT